MTTPRPGPSRSWVVICVPLLFFGSFALWSLATPVMGVPDEPAHTIKAASVWHGQLRGEVVQVDSGDPDVPIPVSYDQVRVPASYAELPGLPVCYAFYTPNTADCAPEPGTASQLTDALTAAGPYPPLFYVLVGWPSRVVGAELGTHLMRLTSAAFCALFIGLGFASLRRVVRPGLALAGIALATTPMVHFLAGSVNPNGFEVAAAIGFWCAALAVVVAFSEGGRPARSTMVAYLVTGAALVLSRSLSPVFAAAALLAALAVVGWPGVRTVLAQRDWWLLNLVLAVPGLAAVLWILTSGHAGTVFGTRPPPDRSLLTVLGGSIDDHLLSALALFGWKDTGPVVSAILPWLCAVAILIGVAALFGSRWEVSVLGAVVVAGLLMPVVAQWPSARSEGLAWQGRYQLPLLVGIPLLATWVARSFSRRFPGPDRRLVAISLGVVAAALTVCHVVVMQRNVVGSLGPMNYLTGDGFTGPLSRWLMLTGTVAVGLGLLAVGLLAERTTRTGGDDEDSRDGLEGAAGDRADAAGLGAATP